MAKTKTKKYRKKNIDEYNNKHFPCSYCDKTFPEERSRDHHLLLHSSDKPFQCLQCSHTCKTKKYLARHVKLVHTPPSKFKCTFCDKKFHFKVQLDDHTAVHTNSKPHKCNVCGKGFNSRYSLSGHVLIHENLKPFKCKFCEYACRDSSTLRRHHERHMGIVKRYPCDICDKLFSKKSIMLEHVAEVHMNVDVRTIPCDACDKKFKSRTQLNIHVRAVHHKTLVTACEICGRKITNKHNMAAHLLTHVDARPFKCTFDNCTKRYKERSSLKKHSLIHYPEKQFPCKKCGRRFTRIIRLKRHEALHGIKKVRIRKVQCDYCGTIFNSKSALLLHIRRRHPRGKPKLYICDMCDFETTNKPSIIGHIKGHYRKTCKQCYICQRTYKDERWYKQHLLREHNTIEYNGTPTFDIDIKAEPLDVDALPEFELFEVEKEELLEELNSISNEGNTEIVDDVEQDIANGEAQAIENNTRNCKESLVTNTLDVTERVSERQINKTAVNYDETPANDQNSGNSKESLVTNTPLKVTESSKMIQVNESLTQLVQCNTIETDAIVNIGNDEEIPTEVVTINENVTNNTESVEAVSNIEREQNLVPSEKRLENRYANQISKVLVVRLVNLDLENGQIRKGSISSSVERKIVQDYIAKRKKCDHKLEESIKKKKRNNSIINEDYGVFNVLSTEPGVTIRNKNREIRKIQSKKKLSNNNNSVNKYNKDRTKANNLSKKETINNRKNTDNYNLNKSKDTNTISDVASKNSQESEEFLTEEELNDVEYSRTVLSEDLTKVIRQKRKKNSFGSDDFDDFVVENMLERTVGSSNKREELDKKCQLSAKKYLNKLLRETREKREVKLIEKTRMEYNERILRARDLRKEKVSIKYFDKSKKNVLSDTPNNDNEIKANDGEINDNLRNEANLSKAVDTQHKSIHNDSINKTDDNVIESENITTNNENINTNALNTSDIPERDSNIDAVGEKEMETTLTSKELNDNEERNFEEENKSDGETTLTSKELNDNEERNYEEENKSDGERVKETDRVRLRRKRKHDGDSVSEEGSSKKVEESGKMRINTHQCYVCFKLYDTKDKLLDHCKDHFDICSTTILKKCPLCDYATKLNIVQHMKIEHDVHITIPNKRIRQKECLDSGSKYCYKVDSSEIKNIDIIPSVKHLNKQASINIDVRNRKLKDIGIANTKLVKKGNEWIVERKTTKIDNVEDLILPQFEVDEIMSIKVDTNDYLGRIQKLSRLAKIYKRKMVFPCESCEKICQNFSALKLHIRKHTDNKKPFKKKVWKHKMKDMVPNKDKVTDIGYAKKYRRVVELDRIDEKELNKNRYKKPKPIVNKHKCDPELIKFYEANIKGGDVEFWQFLKIFNKMSRENVNDFEDLVDRPEFGIHEKPGASVVNDSNDTLTNDNDRTNEINEIVDSREKCPNKEISNNVKKIAKNSFKRVIRITKKDYRRRNELKQRLREKISKNSV